MSSIATVKEEIKGMSSIATVKEEIKGMTSIPTVKEEQKVYSENGKIFAGMKIEEANTTKEQMQIFNFADMDGDGVINPKEIERYNAPIFNLKKEDAGWRIAGNAKGKVGWLYARLNINGGYSKYNNTEFYAGLNIKDIPPKGREEFTSIDLNSDGVISKSEITTTKEILDKRNKLIKEIQNLECKKDDLNSSIGNTCILAPFGILGAALCGLEIFSLPGAIAGLAIGIGIFAFRLIRLNSKISQLETAQNNKFAELNKLAEGQEPYKEKTQEQCRIMNLTEVVKP